MNNLTGKKDTHRFGECLLLSYQMRCKIRPPILFFLISNSQQYTFLLGLNSFEFSFSSYLALANRVPIEQRSLVQGFSNPHGYAVFTLTS